MTFRDFCRNLCWYAPKSVSTKDENFIVITNNTVSSVSRHRGRPKPHTTLWSEAIHSSHRDCCALRVARCALRVARCALRVARCALRVVRCALRVARCALQYTRYNTLRLILHKRNQHQNFPRKTGGVVSC